MKRTTKIVVLCFFIPIEAFFCLATLVALFMFPPVGIVGLAASTLYMLVIISIFQSLNLCCCYVDLLESRDYRA